MKRQPFQGVSNIVRFNRHFFQLALLGLIALIILLFQFPEFGSFICFTIAALLLLVAIPLLSSYFLYDRSNLYDLTPVNLKRGEKVLVVNAGFDEISELLKQKDIDLEVTSCDFYDPEVHTERSIRNARKIYPPNNDLVMINTSKLPFENHKFDKVIAFMSIHEVRDFEERVNFMKELNRVLKPDAELHLTEHLRDINNFLAYNIGFFHFHSLRSWKRTISRSGFLMIEEKKTSGLVSHFKLLKNGTSS